MRTALILKCLLTLPRPLRIPFSRYQENGLNLDALFKHKGDMKTVVYFTGRTETEAEGKILDKLGTRQIEDGYDFPLWEINFNTIEGLFATAKKLGLISFKAYLPNVNGDEPIIEFCLDKKEKKD